MQVVLWTPLNASVAKTPCSNNPQQAELTVTRALTLTIEQLQTLAATVVSCASTRRTSMVLVETHPPSLQPHHPSSTSNKWPKSPRSSENRKSRSSKSWNNCRSLPQWTPYHSSKSLAPGLKPMQHALSTSYSGLQRRGPTPTTTLRVQNSSDPPVQPRGQCQPPHASTQQL